MVWTVVVFILYMATTSAEHHARRQKRQLVTTTPSRTVSELQNVSANETSPTPSSSSFTKPTTSISGNSTELHMAPLNSSYHGPSTSSPAPSSSSSSTRVTTTETTEFYTSLEWIVGFSVAGSVIIVLTILFIRLCCRYCCGRGRKVRLPVFPPENESSLNDGADSGAERYDRYGSMVNLAYTDSHQSVDRHTGSSRRPTDTDTFRF